MLAAHKAVVEQAHTSNPALSLNTGLREAPERGIVLPLSRSNPLCSCMLLAKYNLVLLSFPIPDLPAAFLSVLSLPSRCAQAWTWCGVAGARALHLSQELLHFHGELLSYFITGCEAHKLLVLRSLCV